MELEEALVGARCALLLVSHDRHFLERTVTRDWHVDEGGVTERSDW